MSNSFPASGVSNNHSYWSASSCSNPPPIGYLGHWKVMVGLSVLVLAGVIVVAYRLLANKKPPVHSQKPQEPTVAQLSTNHNPKKYLYLSVTPNQLMKSLILKERINIQRLSVFLSKMSLERQLRYIKTPIPWEQLLLNRARKMLRIQFIK